MIERMHMLTWLTPGEVLIRDLDGLEEAKRWIAPEPNLIVDKSLLPFGSCRVSDRRSTYIL
jgi:hypothetical protein